MSTALANGGEGSGANTNTGGNSSALSSAGSGDSAGGTSANGGSGNSAAGGGAAAAGSSAASGGAGTGGNWRDTLPDELKSDPILSKYSDLPNAAKALVEAQKAIGKKGVIVPTEKDSPEAWKAFREAIGVPSADKYELGKLDGVEYPAESLEWAKKMGVEVGIRPDDMTKLMQAFGKFEIDRDNKIATEVDKVAKEQMEGLKKEWGEGYNGNLQKGFFAFKQLAELAGMDQKEALAWLDSGPGNDVVVLRMMAGAAKLFGEDKLKEGGVGDTKPNPGELDAKISAVRQEMINIGSRDGRYPGLLSQLESLSKQRTGGR